MSEDNYSIKIDLGKSHYSQGQKASKVLAIIVNLLKNMDKKIILDDFFEKLDIENQEMAMESIINSKGEFEILTHDTNTIGVIQNIAKRNEIEIIEQKITYDKFSGKVEFKNVYISPSFQKLNEKIWGNNNVEEQDSVICIFTKIFGRYIAMSGSLSGDNLGHFTGNKNSESYIFSSKSIFHYDPKIDFNKINEVFLLKSNLLDKDIDSIEFLTIFINKITNSVTNNKYGVSYLKIKEYILQIIQCLEEEKKYYHDLLKKNDDQINLFQQSKSNKFYDKFWRGEAEIKPKILREERNKIIHQLDNSIISIQSWIK